MYLLNVINGFNQFKKQCVHVIHISVKNNLSNSSINYSYVINLKKIFTYKLKSIIKSPLFRFVFIFNIILNVLETWKLTYINKLFRVRYYD